MYLPRDAPAAVTGEEQPVWVEGGLRGDEAFESLWRQGRNMRFEGGLLVEKT